MGCLRIYPSAGQSGLPSSHNDYRDIWTCGTVTFDFNSAITNPTFHLDLWSHLYDFSSTTGLTSLERLSGETDFGVGASQVFDSDGWNVNGRTKGSVLKGTFESISFDVFKANAKGDGDGSGLQISVEVPNPPQPHYSHWSIRSRIRLHRRRVEHALKHGRRWHERLSPAGIHQPRIEVVRRRLRFDHHRWFSILRCNHP